MGVAIVAVKREAETPKWWTDGACIM